MNDNVEILRRYNRWRRGQALWSATADLPDPRVVGEAIDAACDEIERLRAVCEALRENNSDLRALIRKLGQYVPKDDPNRDVMRAALAADGNAPATPA